MIWTSLLIKSVNLIQRILSIKSKIKKMLKFVKNLCLKRKESKSIKSTTSNLASINLLIIRNTFTKVSTIGKLYLNGEEICDTLELPFKDNQRSISCIPDGHYKVRLRLARESATRDYLHLLVKDVPDRDYILFHIGNKSSDSRGCVLVGLGTEQDYVKNSTLAMEILMKEIINLGGENINLIIKNQ
jgi:hypothetical protein